MFFNKGFSEEAINLHARLDCLLFVMLCIFFGLTEILIPKLQSFLKFCHHLLFSLRSSTLKKLLIVKIRQKMLSISSDY